MQIAMLILKLLNSIKCLQFLVSRSELALATLLQRCEQAKVLEQPCSTVSHTWLQNHKGKETHIFKEAWSISKGQEALAVH